MEYNREQYEKDLVDPDFSHTKDKEHYENFYNELGKDPIQFGEIVNVNRINFILPRDRIIELGCHWGFNLIHWAREGFDCTGIEVSKSLVDFGVDQIAQEDFETQSRIKIFHGFVEDFDPQGQKWDTVVVTEILEHVMDPVAILKKAAECVSYAGFVFISSPSARIGNSSHVRGVNKYQLKKMLDEAGLEAYSWIENRWFDLLDGMVCPLTIAVARLKNVKTTS